MPRPPRQRQKTFLADVWFSSYKDGAKPKLAAIIADVSEERTPLSGAPDRVGTARASRVERSRTGGTPTGGPGVGKQRNSFGAWKFLKVPVKNTLQQLFAKTEVRTPRPTRSGCIGAISRSPVRPVARTVLEALHKKRTSTRATEYSPATPEPPREAALKDCAIRSGGPRNSPPKLREAGTANRPIADERSYPTSWCS